MIYRIFIFSILLMSLVGCANLGKELKAFLKGDTSPNANANSSGGLLSAPKSDYVRFSEVKNIPFEDEREYKRMSRKDFEQEELKSDTDGSLWIMEGQDSYLFTENNVRSAGDLINVVLDGQPEKQLSTKAKVIKDLMKKIEAKRKVASQSKTEEKADGAGKPEEAAAPAAAAATAAKTPAASPKAGESSEEEGLDLGMDFDVKNVPSRIVEKMNDGNYRVKGSQNFMIGSKEYKVIVTGLVKPADVNNNSVDSSKILDSKFDIVRTMKR